MAVEVGILPNRPTLDRIGAYYLVEKVEGRPLKIEFVNQTVLLSDDELSAWSDRGVFPIGVGYGETYRDRKIDGHSFGSETAMMLYELRSEGMIRQNDYVLDHFAKMMDQDNSNGYLRRQPYSGCWIVQQAYRVAPDLGQETVHRGAHLVSMYLEALRAGGLSHNMPEHIKNSSAMQLLPKGPARNHQGPMTISRYIRDMYVRGAGEDEILERVGWFVCIHDHAKMFQASADKIAETARFATFPLIGYPKVGTWTDSDDPYLLAALARRRDLVVMRSSKGNIIMMSRTYDLSRVAHELIQKEPGLWHYEPKPRNILANGTESVQIEPTKLSRVTLEYQVGLLVSFMPKNSLY